MTKRSFQSFSGFTLIELLIVIVIFGILAIMVLSSINPIEQISRGRDTARIQLIEHLFRASERMYANNQPPPWVTDVFAAPLNSAAGQLTIANMINVQELKAGFVNGYQKYFVETYMTAQNGYEKRAFCFLPESNAFQDHELTHYTIEGIPTEECPEEGCYLCISTNFEDLANYDPPDSELEPTEEEIQDLCADFDPEWPNYPWTCNSSTTYAYWGCTHFCVTDLGCGDSCLSYGCPEACPPGQRSLMKRHYGVGDGRFECLSHWEETREYYCVPDPYARCDIKSYPSNNSDFVIGCENPRRPIKWIEE
jgi:prepilin-type N-terminal cleavage/methylation domain-containing protein